MNLVAKLSYLFDHLEGIAGFVSLIVAHRVWKDSRNQQASEAKAKEIEIYLNLQETWDEQWAKITAFPELNKVLFAKDFSRVEDENVRVAIMQALNILSRTFYYFKATNSDITQSEWHETVKKISRKNLFVTAFQKGRYRYSKDFQAYMDSHMKQSNVVKVNVKELNVDLKKEVLK